MRFRRPVQTLNDFPIIYVRKKLRKYLGRHFLFPYDKLITTHYGKFLKQSLGDPTGSMIDVVYRTAWKWHPQGTAIMHGAEPKITLQFEMWGIKSPDGSYKRILAHFLRHIAITLEEVVALGLMSGINSRTQGFIASLPATTKST